MSGAEATSEPNNGGLGNGGPFKQRNGSNRSTRGGNNNRGNSSRISSRGRGNSQRQSSNRKITDGGDSSNPPYNKNNNNVRMTSLIVNPTTTTNIDNSHRPKSQPHIYSTTSQPKYSGKSSTQKYSSIESQFVGAFISNPESIGYTKFVHKPKPIPKYLMKEQVQFHSTPFTPNQWDVENQARMLKMEQEYQGDAQTLFEQFQEIRAEERKKMEGLNLVDVENAKKSLSDALIFKGTCVDMCPTYERVERTFKNQVSKWEKDPTTNKISRNYALKTFIRPSGQAPSLPSDVRPPHVLVKTLDYITQELLPKLPDTQSFIWDRTRSIRQDFTFQNNYSGPEAVECHEKICRIHLLSLHVMAGANDPDYQQQQEIEQFINSLQTLTHMYNDVRSRGGVCPNEAEFRAYELLSNLKDSEMDRNIQQLPIEIFESEIVQCALMLRGMVIQPAAVGSLNNFTQFFQVIKNPKTPFLLSCLAESHFNEIRFNALKLMARSFHSKAIPPKVGILSSWLGFDNEQEFMRTVEFLKIPYTQDPESGEIKLDLSVMNHQDFKSSQKQAYTLALNQKIQGKSMSDIINSGKPNGPFGIPMDKNTQALESIARETLLAQRSNANSVDTLLDSTKVSTPDFLESLPVSSEGSSTFNLPQAPISGGVSFGNSNNTMEKSAVPSFNFNMPSTQQQQPSFNIAPSASTPTTTETTQVPKPISEPPIEKPKVFLSQLPEFKANGMKVVDEILSEFMKREVPKVVKHSYEREVHKRKEEKKRQEEEARRLQEQQRQMDLQKRQLRNDRINSLSKELLESFLKEQIYIATMENLADNFAEKTQKRNVLRKVLAQAKISHNKLQYKKRKLEEIEQYVNNVNAPIESRRKIHQPTSILERKKKFAGMFRNISGSSLASPSVSFTEETSKIADTPEPYSTGPDFTVDKSGYIDFKALVLDVFPSHSSLQLNVLVVAPSPDKIEESMPSKWLIFNKFGMKKEPRLNSHFKLIQSDRKRLLISLSPDDRSGRMNVDFKPIHWFKNQNVVIFQVILDSSNEIRAQLTRYRESLIGVIQDIRLYSRRQVNFLVAIFNNTSARESDIVSVLKCGELTSREPKIRQLKIVNLSDFYQCGTDPENWKKLTDKLSDCIGDLASVFKSDALVSSNHASNRSTGSLLSFNQSTLSNIGNSSSIMNTNSETSVLRNKKRERRNEYIMTQLAMSNNYAKRQVSRSLLDRSREASVSSNSSTTTNTSANYNISITGKRFLGSSASAESNNVKLKPVSSDLSKSLSELQQLVSTVKSKTQNSSSRRASDVSMNGMNESFNDSLNEIKDLIHDVLHKK